jgi:hypothetical protein
MSERRKVRRRYLLYYSRVFDAQTGDLLGNLVDITPLGTMLVSEMPIPTDTVFRLKLELSEDIADKPFLECTAKSTWCQPDIAPGSYNTGFQMLDITPQDMEIVQRIIDTYGFRNNY